MNDGLRRTQRTLAPGGRGQGSLRSMPDYAPASYVAIMSQIRGSLSQHPSSQPASALPVACTCGAARRRLAPASRESWSCRAAWCRQPARRGGGHGIPDAHGRLGGDPQIARVRRALRKVSTSGRLAGRLPPCLRPLRPSRPLTSRPVVRIPSRRPERFRDQRRAARADSVVQADRPCVPS
jgi:hypothetical protein